MPVMPRPVNSTSTLSRKKLFCTNSPSPMAASSSIHALTTFLPLPLSLSPSPLLSLRRLFSPAASYSRWGSSAPRLDCVRAP
mmetsp:Transcript_10815/g.19100  ORF Transcript_10815/g.19100 Transcript_10815/m.19100 type:complete len:82 (+) Transcript_10815:843-1088(+)